MKIVVNDCFGGFSLSDFAVEKLGLEDEYDDVERTDARLIALIDEFGSEACSGDYAELMIQEIPDSATDWESDEYDGAESITYVVDGKIRHR